MRIYVLIFFLLCSPSSMAMEMTKKASETGLTIEDATALLHRHARIYVLEDGSIKILFLGFLVADAIFTVLPGLILSVPFTLNTCPKLFGNHQNESFVPVETANLAINGTNDLPKNPQDLCYFGLGLLSVPALSYLGTLFIYPLGKLYQVWALWMNRRIDEKINRELVKDRLKDGILDENDIRYLGKLLFEDHYLLQKLSVNQSLILAEIDLDKFHEEIKSFSPASQQYAEKLLRFLEMSEKEFIEECAKEKVHEIFQHTPSLWQALARISFKKHGEDKKIVSALKESLKKSLTFEVDNFQLDMIFRSVVNEEHSINQIVLKEVFVEKYHNDSKIKIIHGDKAWEISKTRLMEISDFFKTATTTSLQQKKKTSSVETDSSIPLLNKHEQRQKDQVDLSSVDIEFVKVLIEIALTNTVKINNNTITTILDAADYFVMADLVVRCDNFIKEKNLSEEIFEVYESEKSIDIKLAFCKKFGLLENYKALITKTKNRLDNLEMNDLSILDDIQLLNEEEQKEIAQIYHEKNFINKLNEPKFLNVLWSRAKTIAFLKSTIVKFCGNKFNRDVVEKAWVTIPKDLETQLSN